MNFYRNRDGYSDPTAGAALSRIRKQEKWKQRAEIKKQLRILEMIAAAEKKAKEGNNDNAV